MIHLLEKYGLELILFTFFVILLAFGLILKKEIFKHLCFNVAALFFALGSFELYLTINIRDTYSVTDKAYFTSNELLGYGPESSGKYHVNVTKKFKNSGDTIFHVKYGFNEGLRVTTEFNKSSNRFAFFFGGSFVFGEGVNDNETLPSFFARMNKEIMVRNYGFHGYGTHQSLVALREVILKDSIVVDGAHGDFYYLFIPDHINRVIGNARWDTKGPYYYLNEGNLQHGGTIEDLHLLYSRWNRAIRLIWLNSKLYGKFFYGKTISKERNLNLITAIIQEMKNLAESGGHDFTVLFEYQPDRKELIESIKKELDMNGVRFVDLKEALPVARQPLYLKNDPHPGPKYYQLVAKHLTECIFQRR